MTNEELKMAQAVSEATAKNEKPKEFSEHLADLYEYFGPKLGDDIDPPEVILSGMGRTDPDSLTFDQLNLLNLECLRVLAEQAKSTDKLDKLTFKDKVGAFQDWLRLQSFEMQVLSLRQAGLDPELNGKALKEVMRDFDEFGEMMAIIAPKI